MSGADIPAAAVEVAAKRAWLDSALGRRTCDAWEALTELEQTLRRDDARRILEAAAPHMRQAFFLEMNLRAVQDELRTTPISPLGKIEDKR